MKNDLAGIATDLVRWLQAKPGVSNVQAPNLSPHSTGPRFRVPVPLPPALRRPTPSFEIRFTFKGRPRVFRYFIEMFDDPDTIRNTLRVHTNGELMVRVPDAYGHLQENDIYYSNRSATATTLGKTAPNS